MPTPQPPLLLVDNLLDTIQQYPAATLSADSESVGREARRVADYRRDRSYWMPTAAAAGHYLQVDLGAAMTRAVDALWIDRGHNLWGKTLNVRYSDTGTLPFTTHVALTVPASGTIGGDPTTATMSATEEGALYALFTASAVHRYWQVFVVDNMQPVVPGVILGKRTQLPYYSAIYDEDQGERVQRTEQSDTGALATSRVYAYRTLDLDLQVIGDTVYDAQIRALRAQLFEANQPGVVALNYGLNPERAWLFQAATAKWGFPKKGAYRAGKLSFREVGAKLR